MRASWVFVIAQAVLAQSQTATVRGTITTSEDGGPVAGALIEVRNSGNGDAYKATSSVSGSYEVAGLPPATYKILIRAPKLIPYSHVGVELSASQVLVEDAELPPLKSPDGLAQPAILAEELQPCSVVSIKADAEHKLYDYTFWGTGSDEFTGVSWTPLRVHQGGQTRCSARGRFIYLVDDDGRIQTTHFFSVSEVVRLSK
jgi:hypothetical protein